MRRSICQSDPKVAYAGSSNTWKFIYTTATALPKGTNLKFEVESEGKPNDWQIPSASLKDKSNMIWLELPNGKAVKATPCKEDLFGSSFEFVLPSDVKATESVVILMGSPTEDKKTKQKATSKTKDKALITKIGDENYAGLKLLISCKHNEAYGLTLVTSKSSNLDYQLAAYILQALKDKDRNNVTGITNS